MGAVERAGATEPYPAARSSSAEGMMAATGATMAMPRRPLKQRVWEQRRTAASAEGG